MTWTNKILRWWDLIIKYYIKNLGNTAWYSWFARLGCGDGSGGCGLWADVTSFPVADSRMVSLEIWPHPSGRQRDAHGKITRYNRSGARASLWRAAYDDYYTSFTHCLSTDYHNCVLTIFFHFFSFPFRVSSDRRRRRASERLARPS